MGRRQPADRRGAVRGAARQGRLAPRGASDLYVVDAFAGADPAHRLALRVITYSPWHALFAKTLFIEPDRGGARATEPRGARPPCAGRRGRPGRGRHAQRDVRRPPPDARRGADRRHVLRRRDQEVDLHAHERPAAARGRAADALLGERRRRGRGRGLLRALGHGQDDALGRSRAAPDRRRRARLGRRGRLQHRGRLLREGDPPLAEAEPQIFTDDADVRAPCSRTSSSTSAASSTSTTTRRPRTRAPPTSSSRSRTRCPTKRAGHPSAVVFLTADAFGILPPIARLTREQAMFYFLSGFTAKLAGTEIGVTEPQPTFSACFGAPFLPQPPAVYAHMLGEKLDQHARTRLAREHRLDGRAVRRGRADADQGDKRAARRPRSRASSTASSTARTESSASTFRWRCRASTEPARPALDVGGPGRPTAAKARELARMFRDNFKQFADDAGEAVAAAGPRV